MNINEVEKHVKFDLIFTMLVILGVAICILLTLAVIFKPINASALSETNVINGITAGQYCSSHPQSSVCTAQIYQSSAGNPCGNGDARCVTYMSSIVDNKVMSVNFYLNTTIQGYTANTLTLYGTGFDNVNYGCSMSQSSCVVVRYSDHININFYNRNSTSLSNPVQFDIYTDSGFNSNKSFRLTGAKLFQNDIGDDSGGGSSSSFDDSGIINNANSNTQDIINSNNTNAQETQTTINNWGSKIFGEFANMCKNLFDTRTLFGYGLYNYDGSPAINSNASTINNTSNETGSVNVTIVGSGYGFVTDYLPIDYSLNYYINYSVSGSSSITRYHYVFMYDSNKSFLGMYTTYNNHLCQNQSACFSSNTKYIRLIISPLSTGTFQYSNIRLNVNADEPFCAFGSSTNKLDGIQGAIQGGLDTTNENLEDIKDIQQDTYDYISDDSDPNVNTSDVNNVISSVQVQDPLNYLLTLPLNLLTKLNTLISSGTCNRAVFGTLYNTELYLPCINFETYLGSSLWSTIDTIVGVGLLVVIIKKFYDTISNILSLGKEEEIRKGMELPTPMEFLAQILGGGK